MTFRFLRRSRDILLDICSILSNRAGDCTKNPSGAGSPSGEFQPACLGPSFMLIVFRGVDHETKTNFKELSPAELRWTCTDEIVPFTTTDDCPTCDEIIGQERALKAIQTGLDIKSLGYNIFITGMVGTGRTTTIKQLLERLEKGEKTPDDILYVNNFKYPDEPVLITLPAGQGRLFNEAMEKLIEMLKVNVPALLKSKYYSEKRDQIVEKPAEKTEGNPPSLRGGSRPSRVLPHPGPDGALRQAGPHPGHRGPPTPFAKLEAHGQRKEAPQKALDELKKNYDELTNELEGVFETLRDIDEETRTLLKNWDAEAITPIIKGGDLRNPGQILPTRARRLPRPGRRKPRSRTSTSSRTQKRTTRKAGELGRCFLEYRVNLLVDNSDLKGAPVIMETNPNYINLFGSIESTYSRLRHLADRLHEDQGRFLPQSQRRLPGHQRPGRPGRARRLGDPETDPAEPDLRDPELCLHLPLLHLPAQAATHHLQRQGGHDRGRLCL